MRKLSIIASLLTLILAGCAASGPTIMVNTVPGADLSGFETFNFMQPLGTDRDNGARTPMSSMLMDAMTRELTTRGLTQSDSPDLMVDFFVTTEDRMDVRTTRSSSMHSMHSVHRSHWGRSSGFSTWPSYQTTVRQYTQGTLLVDLIDPAANALVAEGSAQNRIRNNELTRQQVGDIVGQVMTNIWAN
jgi:hypothetical protein